jgi:hypothetical protein
LPARIKKGIASSGKELILLKANPAIPSRGIPITVKAMMREPKAKAIASGMPVMSNRKVIATVITAKIFILTQPFRAILKSSLDIGTVY